MEFLNDVDFGISNEDNVNNGLGTDEDQKNNNTDLFAIFDSKYENTAKTQSDAKNDNIQNTTTQVQRSTSNGTGGGIAATNISPHAILARSSASEQLHSGGNMSNPSPLMDFSGSIYSPQISQANYTPTANTPQQILSNYNTPIYKNEPTVASVGSNSPAAFNTNNTDTVKPHNPVISSSIAAAAVAATQSLNNSRNNSAHSTPNMVTNNGNDAFTDRAQMYATLQQRQQQRFQSLNNQQQLPGAPQQQVPGSSTPPLTKSRMTQQPSNLNQQRNILQGLEPALQQRISLQLNNKQYELFMKSIIENCRARNVPLQALPEIQGKKINLFFLYMLVQRFGGGESITRNNQWVALSQKLQISDHKQLEDIYFKILLPYEKYMQSPEGIKETQAKKVFLQQFLQELLKKVQQLGLNKNTIHGSNSLNGANDNINGKQSTPIPSGSQIPMRQANNDVISPNSVEPTASVVNESEAQPSGLPSGTPVSFMPTVTTSSMAANKKQVHQQQFQQQFQQQQILFNKKSRKPKEKKKGKKQIDMERKQVADMQRQQQIEFERQQNQKKHLIEKQANEIYEAEMKRLPKVYKRTKIKNYVPLKRKVANNLGYDLNYVSKIGEKIDANKPIFLFTPEMGTINLNALSMSLETHHRGEVNTALNTLLVVSSDNMLNINLDDCPQLLNSLCKVGIKNISTLALSDDSNEMKNTGLFFDSYCEEYDLDKSVLRSYPVLSKANHMIEHVFERFQNSFSANSDLKIMVDSLTGQEIEQIPTPTGSPLSLGYQTNDDKDLISIVKNLTNRGIKEWDYLPDALKEKFDSSNINLTHISYQESLKKVKDEVDTPYTEVYVRDAEKPRVLVCDQLNTITMIIRNISFSEANAFAMSKNIYLKRLFSDLLFAVFLHHDKFPFERKCFNLKKDIIIILSNLAHRYEVESQVDAFMILLLVLSFGDRKNTVTNYGLSYKEALLTSNKYQTYSVDVLTKLLSLPSPNRQIFKVVLLEVFEDKQMPSQEHVLLLRLKENYESVTRGNLYNDTISFLISSLPFSQLSRASFASLEQFIPLISQGVTALSVLLQYMDTSALRLIAFLRRDKTGHINLPLNWLTDEHNIGYSFRHLSDVLLAALHNNQTMYQKPDSKLSYDVQFLMRSICIKCLEVMKAMVQMSLRIAEIHDEMSSSAKSTESQDDVKRKLNVIPNLLITEAEFLALLTNGAIDVEIMKYSQQYFTVCNSIMSSCII